VKQKSKLFLGLPILLVLAGLVVYQYGYEGLQDRIKATRESESVKIRTLKKYTDFVAQRPGLEKRLASLTETRKALESQFIQGQTPNIAAASLQNSIKTLITSKGGTISSERVEKPEDLEKFNVITVSMDGTVPDTRFLNEILFALETQTPSLAMRELDVRVRDFRNPRELMVRLKVSGIASGK
jgi:hypothetical protein